MARKKKISAEDLKENESVATPQPITETLKVNYMPYAMTVIVSRAIPEIDGFKPAHRKLLYTMYNMGLMTGNKTKSANIVGQTMKLNPHGDASIYETMVRLTRGNGALLHPLIDSKGAFGKHYSLSMTYAASRYTEAKLDPFCQEIFSGIDKNAVDFVPNYDNTMEEPTLLPTTFPNILVTPNMGIAVGMASNICPFNLEEICDGTIALLKNPKTTVERFMEIVKGPDFPGGATIMYDYEQMKKIYLTGTGSIKMQAKYRINEKEHSIDVYEIPDSAYIENIIKKGKEMMSSGKLKEVNAIQDAVDISEQKLIYIELKKDAKPEVVMQKLLASTELRTNFDCNFNVLIDGTPKTLGVRELLLEWITFRKKCLTRELNFTLGKKQDKLHLLQGLAKLMVDIDKAIRIIRGTEDENDVVPNLMKAFGITEKQAEYIAEIKLRHLNRQYIINKMNEFEQLEKDIAELKGILRDDLKLRDLIISQLKEIKKKYGKPRRTDFIEQSEIQKIDKKDLFFENYKCRLVLTKGGYFKKISLQGMRSGDEQKLKEGDYVIYEEDTDNTGEVFFVTDKRRFYKVKVSDFDLSKPSQMGDYVPTKLSMDDDERVIACKMIKDINVKHHMIYIFENGKGVRVPMSAYDALPTRKKITGVCSSSSPLVAAFYEGDKPLQIFIRSDMGRGILIKSSIIPIMSTRTASGNQILQFAKKVGKIDLATDRLDALGTDVSKCYKTVIPNTGSIINQLTFNF